MRCRVSSLTFAEPLSARETVARETPASLATCSLVTIDRCLPQINVLAYINYNLIIGCLSSLLALCCENRHRYCARFILKFIFYLVFNSANGVQSIMYR